MARRSAGDLGDNSRNHEESNVASNWVAHTRWAMTLEYVLHLILNLSKDEGIQKTYPTLQRIFPSHHAEKFASGVG